MKITPPDLAHVTALPLMLRRVVPPEYSDENRHMNVRHYLALFDDAGYPLIEMIGLTPEFYARTQRGGFDLEHHVHYLNEVLIGDTVAVYARLLGRSAKRMHYMLFMVNEARANLAAVFECVNSHADLTVRRTAEWPDEIAAALDRVIAENSALGWAAPVCGVIAP
ncbi:MAG: thioesterase family protein [Chloroflexi bacterium]|jgi:acyl-CoA thioester hydrolase|nr:MAG: L-carnitine dehydrogenase [Chloroflexi bacterium OLB13]MBC6956755.1 thioesterase [Chloroflexota bacterium]MBV6436519.1 hypothetical protein [Anaerolineae bacterium]MDL1916596.1 thioesterase [Anaerolineae bacterium CFX4]OQY86201.1 MAG: hypothetical protein B6D42_01810 [Anaerolineae bacterium UTCFX5]